MAMTDWQKREWLYRLSNLRINRYPFEHAILEDTIPADLYGEMLDNLPPHDEFVPLHSTGRVGKGAYPNRFVHSSVGFWEDVRDFLLVPEFGLALGSPFGLRDRLNGNRDRWAMDTLLIEDLPGYRIGPHADAKHKLLSALFYLGQYKSIASSYGEITVFPASERPEWGTSLYQPKEPADVDPNSGRHYELDQFERITTVPYDANSGLIFLKSDKSWHGVETIPPIERERRIVLLADIKLRN